MRDFKAHVKLRECGTDTCVPMLQGFKAIFPVAAINWLRQEMKIEEIFMDGDEIIVRFSQEGDAENLVHLWNSR